MPSVSGEDLEISLVPHKAVHKTRALGPDSLRVTNTNFEGRIGDVGPVEVHVDKVPGDIETI